MQWGGSGAPLLFLHGAGGPMIGAPFLDELAKHFTVYAPAHPGFGAGEGIEHLDDIIDFALYYLDFLDELQIDNPHIVGHSMGGMLAARFALLYPDATERLVLYNQIGLTDARLQRPPASVDEVYKQSKFRYVRYDVRHPAAAKKEPPELKKDKE